MKMRGKFFCVEMAIVLLFIASAFVFLLESPLHPWGDGQISTDSSVFETVGMMMHKGFMPYRDSFDHKGPLIYFYNWMGQFLGYRGVWVIEYVSLLVTLVIMYRTARIICSRVWAVVTTYVAFGLLFYSFGGGNFTEEYALPFIAGALYIFLDYFVNNRITKYRLLLCGLSCAAVCLLRINMISVWAFFCCGILIDSVLRKKWKELRGYLIWFSIGAILLIVPFFAWLFINHTFDDFWKGYIVFNFTYINAEDLGSTVINKWGAFFRFLKTPVVLLGIVLVGFEIWRDNKQIYAKYFCFLLFSLWTISISGMNYPHYLIIFVPMLVFPIATMFRMCEDAFGENGKVICLLVSAYFTWMWIIPDWCSEFETLRNKFETRGIDKQTDLVRDVCDIVIANTDSDDRITVYGNWNAIYVLTNRMHATRFSYQYPIAKANREFRKEYFSGLEEQLPKMVIVQPGRYDVYVEEFLESNDYCRFWENISDGVSTYIYIHMSLENYLATSQGENVIIELCNPDIISEEKVKSITSSLGENEKTFEKSDFLLISNGEIYEYNIEKGQPNWIETPIGTLSVFYSDDTYGVYLDGNEMYVSEMNKNGYWVTIYDEETQAAKSAVYFQ